MTKLSAWKKVLMLRNKLLPASVAISAVVVSALALVMGAQAQTFTTLVNFNGKNGGESTAPLTQGLDGAFYGTTSAGGANGQGTVFRVSAQDAVRTLYNFCSQSNCTDGANPRTGMVLAVDGYFHGVTAQGGADFVDCGPTGCGAAFKINASGALNTIYSFCARSNCADGVFPFGGLIQATDLNFYGTTNQAGPHSGGGTVFRLSRQDVLTTIHGFCNRPNCLDGADSWSTLTQGSDGNLYGTTRSGGAYGNGEVFKITPTGQFSVFHSFCPPKNCSDGGNPLAGVIEGSDSNFYGTTSSPGTVFKITPQGDLTTLYLFCRQTDCPDGNYPVAPLIQATDGNFYGTTSNGANPACGAGCGTVFSITPQGTLTTLHTFCSQTNCADGGVPDAGLFQGTDGQLYGTTSQGGGRNCNCGTVFSLSMGLGPFVAFVHDTGQVGQPIGILGQGFIGTTSVSLNGIPASFTVKSDTFITATVPPGATTGFVTVVTPSGTLTSNVPFRVLP
jgi:uncharacterized repeat protein (TIGR03803 family)